MVGRGRLTNTLLFVALIFGPVHRTVSCGAAFPRLTLVDLATTPDELARQLAMVVMALATDSVRANIGTHIQESEVTVIWLLSYSGDPVVRRRPSRYWNIRLGTSREFDVEVFGRDHPGTRLARRIDGIDW